MGSVKNFLARNSPTILTCIGAVGVVTTAVLAVKSTPKAMRLIEAAKDEKGEELTKFEIVKAAGPAYIPSCISCLATLLCIFGANTLNKKQQAAIVSAYALIDTAYKEYRNKVREEIGTDEEARIEKDICRDKYADIVPQGDTQLFYDMQTGQYFESTIEVCEMDDGLECYIVDLTPIL